MWKGSLVISLVVLILGSSYQDKKQPKFSDKDIDNAIKKGTSWLTGKLALVFKGPARKNLTSIKCEELVLYTLAHAGINEKNESFKKLLQLVLATKPSEKRTYNAAVEIMALSALDKKNYKDRMAKCAQFIVNGQAKNGQWWYDLSTKKSIDIDPDKTPSTHDKKDKIIKRQKWCGDKGDNSNSQYVALALRACHEAGIEFDKDIIKLAKESWEKGQNDDGGWSYQFSNGKAPSYGSMTVGGLASYASFKAMLKEDLKGDKCIEKAVEWLTKNFAVDKNPEYKGTFGKFWQYYYLYGLERAGALAGIEKFGDHDWYLEGAALIIKEQESDGHWNSEKKHKKMAASSMEDVDYADTCFAILFLKRATELLIETGK